MFFAKKSEKNDYLLHCINIGSGGNVTFMFSYLNSRFIYFYFVSINI